MKNEASLQQLIDSCNEHGWDKVINSLERIVFQNEQLQAHLFAGDFNQIKQAEKLSKTIIKQNITIGQLKHNRKEWEVKK